MAKDSPIQSIEKSLIGNDKGLTIQQIIDKTGLARGTVKTYLDELIRMGRVHEEEYGQNTKVFFLNGVGKYQQQVQMYTDGVLFIDVMTDPWKKPFIRVKLRNNKKDVGAIFLNNEESVDELINVLQTAKPQLKKYKEMIEKLGPSQ
ncbi:winged helix-turn-helix domain-containing protein [Candidatus Woesearchaeota archaeon]|nr:winged helix-turn-helix domain-containing protein [Candidatus Woesearchaeota archaeon]